MASIKVAIRCRPFTIDDKLGVVLQQNGDEEGEVQLINTDYTTTRFAFTWAWWSAYGFARRVQGNPPEAESMLLVNQDMAYQSTGVKIKADLLAGNAVVIFAYGLSGSGKTFTVFGPDAIDIPEAWFKHAEPHPLWGIFPRLAYEVFQEKEENWKVTMKYFQNVVDIVRDLMSPTAQEKHYKEGMKKDADGFTDIDWCAAQPLTSWNDLRNQFMKANARKAIAPTQFNHQSTRGHCIMTFQVDRPNPDNPDFKYQGRLYVCDLAGTEPAGDIYFARYEKVSYPDGTVDHNLLGPDPDQKKTKELQDQGKKINLSLTEMSQFFMKMAEAVMAKKLKPGMAIPGCNSYFLCKYLKDTMLQARTYLFCAIRPEVTYSNYTFATLGFAKNASVVKLQPKKATVAMSPGEKKLFAELEQMKALVEQLKAQNQQLVVGGGAGGGGGDMAQLQAMLEAKQKELQNAMYTDGNGQNAFDAEEAMLARQKEEYGRRGIDLTHYSSGTSEPFLINLDEDPFRNGRLMYLLTRPATVFGPKGDIQPLSLSVIKSHCTIERNGDELTLVGGAGETFHNGRKINRSERVVLQPYDRVAMGSELLLFKFPGKNPDSEPPTPSDCFEEYQNALAAKGGNSDLQEQMAKFEEEKANWERNKNNMNKSASGATLDAELEETRAKAMQQVDRDILELLPKVKECKEICALFNRDYLNFEVTLQKTNDRLGIPKIKVQCTNSKSSETVAMDEFEFVKGFSLLKDELTHMRTALENDREYEVPEHHDPVKLLFDNTFHMGTARLYPEYLIYNLETESEEKFQDIINASAPYNKVGVLEVTWSPCDGEGKPLEEDAAFVEDEKDILGKPWNGRIRIKEATGLPVTTDMAYCQYEFFGETFTTETVEQNTRNPRWDYTFVHHVDRVTQDFVDFLKKELEISIFISPYVLPSKDKITTHNPRVLEKLGFQHLITPEMANTPSTAGLLSPSSGRMQQHEQQVKELESKLAASEQEKQALVSQVNHLLAQVAELTRQVETLRGGRVSPRPKQDLNDAVSLDKALNASAAGGK